MTQGQVDTLYIDIQARLDGVEQGLRRLEHEAEATGQRAGGMLSGGFGKALGGLATVAAGAAVAVGGAFAAGIPAMAAMASEADKARASHEMFQKTLERTGISTSEAEKAVTDLSNQLKVSPTIIEEAATTMLRAGASMEDVQKGLLAAGASAAAAGNDIGTAIENASVGIAMGRSELMEYAGIVVNASDAHKAYAKELGVSVDKLTEAQKIQAYANAVYEESKYEIADLGTVMGGLAGQQAEAAMSSQQFREAIGTAVLPIVKELNNVMNTVRGSIMAFVSDLDPDDVQAFAKSVGEVANVVINGLGVAFQTIGPIITGVMSTITGTLAAVAAEVSAFMSSISASMQGANLGGELFAGLQASVAQFQQGVTAAVGAVQGVITGTLLPAFQSLVPVVTLAAAGVADAFRGIQPALAAFFAAFQQTVQGMGPQLQAAAGVLRGAFQGMVQVVGQAVTLIGGHVAKMAPYIGSMIQGLTPIVRSMGPLWSAVANVVASAVAGIINVVRGLMPVFQLIMSVVQRLLPVFVAAFNGIAAVVGAAIRVITGLLNAVAALMRGDLPAAMNAMRGAFAAGAQAVAAIVTGMAGTIKAALVALPAALADIGRQIVAGLVAGIRAGASSVVGAVSDMANNAVTSAKNALGIKSPSRVFAELGRFTAEGFVRGIASQDSKVKASARQLATNFEQAFKDLKVERSLGQIDLNAYIQTLEKAAASLRAKLGTVKEGTPAYSEYLSALQQVSRELEAARGKTQQLSKEQKDAAAAAKKLSDAQQSIRNAEAFDEWKKGLEGLTEAQLQAARAAAFNAGDQQRYSAVVAEQTRRVDEAAAALKRVQDAQQGIRSKEAFAEWTDGLRQMSDAQLQAAKNAAYLAGETEKYNAAAAEQERRVKAVTDAAEKLAAAQRSMTGTLLEEGMTQFLEGLSNADLAQWRDAAFEVGDSQLWGQTRKLMQENGKEVARGFLEGAQEALRNGDFSGAVAVLNEGLVQLGAGLDAGHEVSQGYALLNDRLNQLRDTLATFDPVLADVLASGGVLFENLQETKIPEIKLDSSWFEFLDDLQHEADVDAFTAALEGMDAAQLQAALSSAMLAESQEAVNLVLAASKRYSEAASKNAATLIEAQMELRDAQAAVRGELLESERPYAKQIELLESLRGKPGVVAEELDWLLTGWQNLRAEAEKSAAIERGINRWADYAQRILPVITASMEALGGMSEDAAQQWGESLSSMTSDITNFALAIAKKDYFGAAVQGLATIFNWMNRNKRAAAEAARATADYNAQFRFAGDGYRTRDVESYTTGILFWQTTHYKDQIDETKKNLALSLEGGFVNGIKDGFKQALEQNDFSLFGKSLRENVGEAVLDGVIDAFMNEAVLKNIIGPAIQTYLDTGNAGVLDSAITEATALSERMFRDLRGVRTRLGLDSMESQIKRGDLFGNAPSIQLGIPRIEVQLPDIARQSLTDFSGAVPIFDAASRRMLEAAELILSNGRGAGGPPALSRNGGLV